MAVKARLGGKHGILLIDKSCTSNCLAKAEVMFMHYILVIEPGGNFADPAKKEQLP